MTEVELCWRCGASMNWIQSTWQCPRCRWKLGCCEGEPQSCADPAAVDGARDREPRVAPAARG